MVNGTVSVGSSDRPLRPALFVEKIRPAVVPSVSARNLACHFEVDLSLDYHDWSDKVSRVKQAF